MAGAVRLATAMAELARRERRKRHAGSLLEFVRDFWHVLEPGTKFVDGWVLEAICLHLEAVTDGRIRRLLINVPPGTMKSLMLNVFWPAWEWGPKDKPQMRYIAFSYGSDLTERDNRRLLALVQSPEYRDTYPRAADLTKGGETLIANTATGWKQASSVHGMSTGLRANRVLFDDPHNVTKRESDADLRSTVDFFREALGNRLNDMDNDAIVVVMQRVGMADVSGIIVDLKLGYTHLLIQNEFDPSKACTTSIGWRDPRRKEGELCWPGRISADYTQKQKALMTAQGYAAQYQQTPVPTGGGIFKSAWWRWHTLEGPGGNRFPTFEFTLASLDPAFTDKQENDYCAMTVWGLFRDHNGQPCVMLIYCWQKRLIFRGPEITRKPGESEHDFVERSKPDWGLIEWCEHTCKRYKVDKLLVEAKANGISVAQEIARSFRGHTWGCELVNPGSLNKVNRAHSVTHMITDGIVFLPQRRGVTVPFTWVADFMLNMEVFDRGPHDDIVDSATQALNWFRKSGILIRREERHAQEIEERQYRKPDAPLYPV